jgi:Domain of unknown function (DUF4249)
MLNKVKYRMAVKNILIAIIGLATFCSCEKVINIDLKNAEPKIVIEAVVDNSGRPATVKITKSVSFSNSTAAPTISGAVVKITDNAGVSYNFLETTPGNYVNNNLKGEVGKTYNLTVLNSGITYLGKSTIPRQVFIDTVYQETITIPSNTPGAADTKGKAATLVFTDIIGFGDNVQVVQTINTKVDNTLLIADDQFTDGGSLPYQLYYNSNTKVKTGDSIKVELRCIDKSVYRYLNGIQEIKGGNTVPANPENNITGGCLGFFSAHTSETKTLIIK